MDDYGDVYDKTRILSHEARDKMNKCARVRALRSCSSEVHVARVVVSLVVHAVVGLTLGLIAHVVVVVFVVAFP